MMRDPRRHPRIAPKERIHPILVPRQNDDEIVPIILHHLQQDLDRLLPIIPLVLRPIQIISLVDEQHPAHRLLENLFGLRRGMPDILSDQIIPRHGNHMITPDILQPMQHIRHPTRHRSLPGPRITRKTHMQRRRLRLYPHPPPRTLHQQQRRHLPDSRLDRHQPHQIAIQQRDHLADIALLIQRIQVDPVLQHAAHGE